MRLLTSMSGSCNLTRRLLLILGFGFATFRQENLTPTANGFRPKQTFLQDYNGLGTMPYASVLFVLVGVVFIGGGLWLMRNRRTAVQNFPDHPSLSRICPGFVIMLFTLGAWTLGSAVVVVFNPLLGWLLVLHPFSVFLVMKPQTFIEPLKMAANLCQAGQSY